MRTGETDRNEGIPPSCETVDGGILCDTKEKAVLSVIGNYF